MKTQLLKKLRAEAAKRFFVCREGGRFYMINHARGKGYFPVAWFPSQLQAERFCSRVHRLHILHRAEDLRTKYPKKK